MRPAGLSSSALQALTPSELEDLQTINDYRYFPAAVVELVVQAVPWSRTDRAVNAYTAHINLAKCQGLAVKAVQSLLLNEYAY